MRFSANEPSELAQLLNLLLDPISRKEFEPIFVRRRQERLALLHPDLIGLCLLALARMLEV